MTVTVLLFALIMEPFNIVAEPTLKVVKSLKKADLIQVAQHYKLEFSSTLKKSEISDRIFRIPSQRERKREPIKT